MAPRRPERALPEFATLILETLLALTARTSPALRRQGLVADAVALWSRATRRRRAWTLHERHCHAVVAQVVEELPSRRTALVLGSGLVRDVPLGLLLARFECVILLDAVHLLPVRWLARGPRCNLVVADLTHPDALAPFHGDPSIDLVVSANVLSQLPMAHRREIEDEQEEADRTRRIIAGHLADLAAFPGRVCLLTDVAYRDTDRDGGTSDETVLVPADLLPDADAEWDWDVAPRGEISRRFARHHRVQAFRDLPDAARSVQGSAPRRASRQRASG